MDEAFAALEAAHAAACRHRADYLARAIEATIDYLQQAEREAAALVEEVTARFARRQGLG